MAEVLKPAGSAVLASARNWDAIEHSLGIATKAENLRARPPKLREASRLIREESSRIARTKCRHRLLNDYLAMIFVESTTEPR